MNSSKTKKLVSILMESSLYLTLPVCERRSLLERLEETYSPCLEDDAGEGDAGYDDSVANH